MKYLQYVSIHLIIPDIFPVSKITSVQTDTEADRERERDVTS